MSEPLSAFLKLRISRPNLERWLNAPVPMASRWNDWRAIGGRWYLEGGDADFGVASDRVVANVLADCDAVLRSMAYNRNALQMILNGTKPDFGRIAGFNRAGTEFVAGVVLYAENLTAFIVFLTIARGAADFLGLGEEGIALIHNYIWGDDEEHDSVAGLRLEPSGRSIFMDRMQQMSASAVFEPIISFMMDEDIMDDDVIDKENDPDFNPRIQLDLFPKVRRQER